MCDHQDLLKKLEDLEKRVKLSEHQVEELRKKDTRSVMFSAEAGCRGAIGPYGSDTTLVFQRVITNVGGSYNSSSGVFTAPTSGVYFFTIFHHAGGNHATVLYLCRNGSYIVQTQNHQAAYESAHNGGNAALLQLSAGDRVYVTLQANTHVYGSSYHTTFSGYLVREM